VEKLFKILEDKTSDQGSFIVSFNSHKTSYEPLVDHVKNIDCEDCFVSEEDKNKCLKENRTYELHWYKDTSVGFIKIYASKLELIYEAIKDIK